MDSHTAQEGFINPHYGMSQPHNGMGHPPAPTHNPAPTPPRPAATATAAASPTFSFAQTKQLLDEQRKDYTNMMHVIDKLLSGQHNATHQGPATIPATMPMSLPPAGNAASSEIPSSWIIILSSALIVLAVGIMIMFLLIVRLNRRMKSASWLASILNEVDAEAKKPKRTKAA